MIVDASALLAVIFREEGWEALVERMLEEPVVAAGAPTLAEAAIVLEARLGAASRGMVERVLDELAIQEIPFGEIHWREAAEAYRRFGKGRHPAGLNFGDCLTYAVAQLAGERMLFTGLDFAKTDVEVA
jgi:ribonuclease VapC